MPVGVKRQTIDSRKLLGKHVSDKEFVSKICKELSKLKKKKIKKWGKVLNRLLTKDW